MSGGHCQCVAVEGLGRYTRLGGTVDDAVGEAFDKVAKLLGLGWPGGPALERLAAGGDAAALRVPAADAGAGGLRLQLLRAEDRGGAGGGAARGRRTAGGGWPPISRRRFQRAVAAVLADRARHAMATMRQRDAAARLLVVAGGVAANGAIRAALHGEAATAGFRLVAPPVRLCTDNAVMVAWAGLERLRAGAGGRAGFRAAAKRGRWGNWRPDRFRGCEARGELGP